MRKKILSFRQLNLPVRMPVFLARPNVSFFHYENTPIQIYRRFSPKTKQKSDKTSDIFHISAQNIDCGYSLEPPRRGDSNEYPQSMVLSKHKKNNVYPVNPSFTV